MLDDLKLYRSAFLKSRERRQQAVAAIRGIRLTMLAEASWVAVSLADGGHNDVARARESSGHRDGDIDDAVRGDFHRARSTAEALPG